MRLEFSRFIETDLEAIADFIAADNPSRAVTFIRQIRDAILKTSRPHANYLCTISILVFPLLVQRERVSLSTTVTDGFSKNFSAKIRVK